MPHPIRQGDIPGVQLRYERQFDLPAERLWRWLTEPDLLRRWLASGVDRDVDGAPGWVLRGTDESGRPLVEAARTLVLDDGVESGKRHWTASFERRDDGWSAATRLSLRITGQRPCELTVLQQGFERLPLSRCLTVWELYRRRWRAAFDRLAAALDEEETTSRPSPGSG